MTKRCIACGETKALDDFPKNRREKDGRYAYCRLCSAAKTRAWNAANPKRYKENLARWKAANPGRVASQRREWYRRVQLGMAKGDYEQMLKAQDGVCAICKGEPTGRPSSDGQTVLHVDHCHDSKVVRGLLCGNCNTALGLMKDDVPRLRAAIRYLQKKR